MAQRKQRSLDRCCDWHVPSCCFVGEFFLRWQFLIWPSVDQLLAPVYHRETRGPCVSLILLKFRCLLVLVILSRTRRPALLQWPLCLGFMFSHLFWWLNVSTNIILTVKRSPDFLTTSHQKAAQESFKAQQQVLGVALKPRTSPSSSCSPPSPLTTEATQTNTYWLVLKSTVVAGLQQILLDLSAVLSLQTDRGVYLH